MGPSEDATIIGKTKKNLSERYVIRGRWWTQLLEHAKTRSKLHANISPCEHNWVGTSAGKRGLTFNYTVTRTDSNVELYIDRGKESEEENKSIFNKLFQSKDEIEKAFGDEINWQSLEGKRACRIKKQVKGGYKDDEETWPEIHEKIVDVMIRFHKALKPYIQKLKI